MPRPPSTSLRQSIHAPPANRAHRSVLRAPSQIGIVQEEQRLECPESLALYDRLLHEPCPELLGRAFRLRDRSSLGLGRWALSHVIFVGLKTPLDLFAQFQD